MNIVQNPFFRALLLPVLALGLAACDMNSVDSTSAVVSDNEGSIYNYSGMYMSSSNTSGSTSGYAALVVPAGGQSGTILTWIRLLQYGSVLEAYDNANQVWSGNISAQNGETASFTLSGQTSAGNSVEIVGTLTYVSQQSTMDAAWIEPSFSGNIFAQATVSPVVTNTPPAKFTISPSSASCTTNDIKKEFIVTGGTAPYSWKVSDSSRGSLSSTSGSTVTYTSAHIAGDNTITVADSSSNSVTATVTYTSSGPRSINISPSTLSLSSTVYIGNLKASGGDGTYTWMVGSDSLGTVNPTTGSSVTYTSKKVAGTNTISITDGNNDTATAVAIYR